MNSHPDSQKVDAVAKNVIEQIKKRQIRPIPRWRVLLKRSLLWIALTLFTLLGMAAVALSLVDFKIAVTDTQSVLQRRTLLLLSSLPWVWLGLVAIFGSIALISYRLTPRGYRYSLARVFLLTLFLSILGGGLLHATGAVNQIETHWSKNLEPFRNFQHFLQTRMQQMWMNPESGFLMGRILIEGEDKIDALDSVMLEDVNGTIWQLDLVGAEWRGLHRISVDKRVRIVGRKLTDGKFKASHVLPMPGHGMGRGMGQGPGRGLGPGKRFER
jgi:hypothetical protein